MADYDLPDLESSLYSGGSAENSTQHRYSLQVLARAALLLLTSVTADFHFPQWHY